MARQIVNFPLRDLFIESTFHKSNYYSYINSIITDLKNQNANLSFEQENYLYFVALALCAKDSQYALNLIGSILKFQATYPITNKYSGLNAYKLFIEKLVNDKKYHKIVKENTEFLYEKSDFKTKMTSRLNSQSRLSGDKIWLPLTFIQLLCNHNNRKIHCDFKNKIYEELKIIVKDSIDYIHENIKDFDSFILVPIQDGLYTFFAFKKSKAYQVFTPDILNKKKPLIVSAIDKIAIDHVTPIDLTLKAFGSKLQELKKISQIIKNFKSNNNQLQGDKLERQSYEDYERNLKFLPKINLTNLEKELDIIREDSHYRLISSEDNSQKSNFLDYRRFYKDPTTDNFFAIIYEKVKMNNQDMILLQDLSCTEPCVMPIQQYNQISSNWIECRQVDVDIDKL